MYDERRIPRREIGLSDQVLSRGEKGSEGAFSGDNISEEGFDKEKSGFQEDTFYQKPCPLMIRKSRRGVPELRLVLPLKEAKEVITGAETVYLVQRKLFETLLVLVDQNGTTMEKWLLTRMNEEEQEEWKRANTLPSGKERHNALKQQVEKIRSAFLKELCCKQKAWRQGKNASIFIYRLHRTGKKVLFLLFEILRQRYQGRQCDVVSLFSIKSTSQFPTSKINQHKRRDYRKK